MEYTKGEWKVAKMYSETSSYMILDNQGQQICGIWLGNTASKLIPEKEHEANAHLIAAAPDLYKGLKDALREICRLCVRLNPQHENCMSCEEMERSRKPLLKAEGK